MRIRDREIEKINKFSIKPLEKVLYEIDKHENNLCLDFDNNMQLILKDIYIPILENIKNIPNIDKIETKKIIVNNKEYIVPINFLKVFHKSYIDDPKIREVYEKTLGIWFDDKSDQLKSFIKDVDSYDEIKKILPPAFALGSLAVTSFHKRPNMVLRDVQKLTGIAISQGDIAELGTGEGKTLSAVLPAFLQSLRGKGVHVVTANSFLANRDYEETFPIYEGLGITSGYVPDNEEEYAKSIGKDYSKLNGIEKKKIEEELKKVKQNSYRKDITYGSKEAFAFDYLRDNLARNEKDFLQRVERVGFAIIDEVDDVLIDDALTPYRIAVNTPMYKNNMNLEDLCNLLYLDYDKVSSAIKEFDIDTNNLSYEDARYIAVNYGGCDILPNPEKIQEAADLFFRMQKIFYTENNQFGFNTSREVFDALLNEKEYDASEIRSKYGVIFCKELEKYKISDKCYEDFVKYCYFSFHINSLIIKNTNTIKNDSNYIENVDYYYFNGKMKLTENGANKILSDDNYPIFLSDYNKYLANVVSDSAILYHYLQKAADAYLLMKNNEDYIVVDNKVKTLKNGRIEEGSTYSDGLHQAIEIKEKINPKYRTSETTTSTTITQKDFFERYDMFSGMTGTSSKSVFGEIFGKGTVEIPKHAFYSYYSKRKIEDAKKPLGIEKKDTVYSVSRDEKINLMIKSIIESQSMNPKQPVLLVVSNYDDIPLIENKLKELNLPFNTLTATASKEEEALIIARSGISGNITISTEMAGRGTDIKIGGDRETIIDIATKRHIELLEKKYEMKFDFTTTEKEMLRKKVENALKDRILSKEEEEKQRDSLELTGLKVISSGFFKMNRIDRQLEGRCGRNGVSGVCERFVCIDDLKELGISSFNGKDSIVDFFNKFNKRDDSSLDIDENNLKHMEERIFTVQKFIEKDIKDRIKDSQKLNNYSTKLVEEYRDRRRKIISKRVDFDPIIINMIEESTNAIISSFIKDKELTKNDLKTPINKTDLLLDSEALSLEVKRILGISFDYNVIEKSNINLLELRNAIIRTAKERIKYLTNEQKMEILLRENDYVIANVVEILDSSFTVKNLTSMSMGLEGMQEALANIEFSNSKRKITYDAYKEGLRNVIGLPLTNQEFKKLEMKKSKLYSMLISPKKDNSFDVKEPKYSINNINLINKLKEIKKKLEIEDAKKLKRIEKKLGRHPDLDREMLYKNLNIRPVKFIKSMSNDEKLVINRNGKKEKNNVKEL